MSKISYSGESSNSTPNHSVLDVADTVQEDTQLSSTIAIEVPVVGQVSRMRSYTKRLLNAPTKQIYALSPLHNRVESLAKRLLVQKTWALKAFHAVMFVLLVSYTFLGNFSASVEGFSKTSRYTRFSSLTGVEECGLNLNNCQLKPNQKFSVRCPAGCLTASAWTPEYVGGLRIQHEAFVVGSKDLYRGDSWVCVAALQQNIISQASGGCVVVETITSNDTFVGAFSNGVTSFDFDSQYPLSFRLSAPTSSSFCEDPSFSSGIVMIVLLLYFPFLGPLRGQFFYGTTLWMMMYWIFLSSDIGKLDHNLVDAMSIIFPFVSSLYVVNVYVIEKSLPEPSVFPLDVSILWTIPFLIGMYLESVLGFLPPLPNMTFQKEMLQRADSFVFLCILVVLFLLVTAYFIMIHRKAGTLAQTGSVYLCFVVLFALGPFFGFVIHLHHYMLALLLLGATRLQTRVSMICQGFAIGLFAQGVIKWGFASPIETRLSYVQANGFDFGGAKPEFTFNDTNSSSITWAYNFNASASLTDLYIDDIDHSALGADLELPISGYKLTMNDVEVYRGKRASYNLNEDLDVPFDVKGGPMYFKVAAIAAKDYQTQDRAYKLDYSDVLKVDFDKNIFEIIRSVIT